MPGRCCTACCSVVLWRWRHPPVENVVPLMHHPDRPRGAWLQVSVLQSFVAGIVEMEPHGEEICTGRQGSRDQGLEGRATIGRLQFGRSQQGLLLSRSVLE